METIEYRTRDKSNWGDGPWQTEPDKAQWPDPATGLPCLITRAHHGALCGYVGVPQGHPYYGLNYSNVSLTAHGGLTFASACDPDAPEDIGVCHRPGPGEPDHVWWFGFDCAHAWDHSPGMRDDLRAYMPPEILEGLAFFKREEVYRPFDYVQKNVTNLAAQLHEAANRQPTTEDQPA